MTAKGRTNLTLGGRRPHRPHAGQAALIMRERVTEDRASREAESFSSNPNFTVKEAHLRTPNKVQIAISAKNNLTLSSSFEVRMGSSGTYDGAK